MSRAEYPVLDIFVTFSGGPWSEDQGENRQPDRVGILRMTSQVENLVAVDYLSQVSPPPMMQSMSPNPRQVHGV